MHVMRSCCGSFESNPRAAKEVQEMRGISHTQYSFAARVMLKSATVRGGNGYPSNMIFFVTLFYVRQLLLLLCDRYRYEML
jgi:hypothetical protein